MRITNEHRKAINARAREICGERTLAHVEVALRYGQCGHPEHDHFTNLRNFELCTSDLSDLTRLGQTTSVEDHPSGIVILDLFVYTRNYYGRGGPGRFPEWEAELFTNLTAYFANGALVEVSEEYYGHYQKRSVEGETK